MSQSSLSYLTKLFAPELNSNRSGHSVFPAVTDAVASFFMKYHLVDIASSNDKSLKITVRQRKAILKVAKEIHLFRANGDDIVMNPEILHYGVSKRALSRCYRKSLAPTQAKTDLQVLNDPNSLHYKFSEDNVSPFVLTAFNGASSRVQIDSIGKERRVFSYESTSGFPHYNR